MDKVKLQELVNEIVSERVAVESAAGGGMLHMVFAGASDAEQAAVARSIYENYTQHGLLPGSAEGLVEVSYDDLVGQFVGQTAVKTSEVIKRAVGGILLVREAHTLSRDWFGQEALNELLYAMERERGQLMVILAGGSDDMERFLEENAGFRSRIARTVLFED